MVFSRQPYLVSALFLDGSPDERVERFTYLRSIITDQLDMKVEIKHKIVMAKTTFTNMQHYFFNDNPGI